MKLNLITTTLLLASASAIAEPNITISTTTNSRDFPLSAEQPLVVPLTKDGYTLKITGVEGDCVAPDGQKVKFNKPIALNCGKPTELPLKVRFTGDYSFAYDDAAKTLLFKREPKKAAKTEFKRPIPQVQCEVYQGGEVTIALGDSFPEGIKLRDAYSGQMVEVKEQKVSLTPSKDSGGLVLLEPVQKTKEAVPFDYRNANIYFVMVDRFNNADASNDNSYGRKKRRQR